ncbi:MAG: cytochrome c [Planctomycetota bacterium]|nr:cytochrome c [Planctomycetota bacterium]
MKRLTLLLAGAALSLGMTLPASDPLTVSEGDEHGHDSSASAPEGPHDRPPLDVVLDIHTDAWLRAPSEDWFEAQAELDPDRFSYVDDLLDIDGDTEGGYQDKLGEYELRYDAEEDEIAYWQYISADRLTQGRRDYVQFCSSCHGFDGDGYGRSGQHLRPPPRNFTKPFYKFTKVPGHLLPSDESLILLVERGLNGTPMLPWALSRDQLNDIIQYLKSLSPEGVGWRDVYSEVGHIVESDGDPWTGREAEAIQAGQDVYHGTAKCYSCHPGYVTPEKLAEINGLPAGSMPRENFTYPIAKITENYEVQGVPMLLLPPDFTWQDVRAGTTPLELFETIGAGIGGTAMPQWKGSLSDKDIWAMAYYVRSLIETYKGHPEKRAEFMSSLRTGR